MIIKESIFDNDPSTKSSDEGELRRKPKTKEEIKAELLAKRNAARETERLSNLSKKELDAEVVADAARPEEDRIREKNANKEVSTKEEEFLRHESGHTTKAKGAPASWMGKKVTPEGKKTAVHTPETLAAREAYLVRPHGRTNKEVELGITLEQARKNAAQHPENQDNISSGKFPQHLYVHPSSEGDTNKSTDGELKGIAAVANKVVNTKPVKLKGITKADNKVTNTPEVTNQGIQMPAKQISKKKQSLQNQIGLELGTGTEANTTRVSDALKKVRSKLTPEQKAENAEKKKATKLKKANAQTSQNVTSLVKSNKGLVSGSKEKNPIAKLALDKGDSNKGNTNSRKKTPYNAYNVADAEISPVDKPIKKEPKALSTGATTKPVEPTHMTPDAKPSSSASFQNTRNRASALSQRRSAVDKEKASSTSFQNTRNRASELAQRNTSAEKLKDLKDKAVSKDVPAAPSTPKPGFIEQNTSEKKPRKKFSDFLKGGVKTISKAVKHTYRDVKKIGHAASLGKNAVSKAFDDNKREISRKIAFRKNAVSKAFDFKNKAISRRLNNKNPEVRANILSHPNVTREHIQRGLADIHPEVRSAAWKRGLEHSDKNIKDATIASGLRHNDPSIRKAARLHATNVTTTMSSGQALKKRDEDRPSEVRKAAEETAARLHASNVSTTMSQGEALKKRDEARHRGPSVDPVVRKAAEETAARLRADRDKVFKPKPKPTEPNPVTPATPVSKPEPVTPVSKPEPATKPNANQGPTDVNHELLSHPNPGVRAKAFSTPHDITREHVIRGLKDEHADVRKAAITAAASHPKEVVRSTIFSHGAKHTDPEVKAIAKKAIKNYKDGDYPLE